jgi:hypothetical protein
MQPKKEFPKSTLLSNPQPDLEKIWLMESTKLIILSPITKESKISWNSISKKKMKDSKPQLLWKLFLEDKKDFSHGSDWLNKSNKIKTLINFSELK